MVWKQVNGIIGDSIIDEVVEFVQCQAILGLDIETDDLAVTCNITSIQVGTSDIAYFVDTRDSHNLSIMLQVLSMSKDTLFVIHNSQFDCVRLLMKNGCRLHKIWDTFVTDIKLHNGILFELVDGKFTRRSSSLKAVINRMFGVMLNKEEATSFKGREPYRLSQIKYGLADVIYLPRIMAKQEDHAKLVGNFKGVNLENAAALVITEMVANGIYLNFDKWTVRYNAVNVQYRERIKAMDKALIDYSETDNRVSFAISNQLDLFNSSKSVILNYNSTADMIKLFEAMGLDLSYVDKKTREVKKTVNAEELGKYSDNPVVAAYIAMKELYKDVTTYGLNWSEYVNPVTGRIHTKITQLKSTGRTSSTKPNIQNLPSDVTTRSCFTNQKEGWSMLSADYHAQEIVVSADFSRDPVSIEIIEKGLDSHSITATAISPIFFGEEIEVTDANKKTLRTRTGSLLRDIAKQLNFSISYLVGPATVSKSLKVSFQDAGAMINAVVKKFKIRHKFFDFKFEEAVRNGYITLNSTTNSRTYLPNYSKVMSDIKKYGGIYVPRYKKVVYSLPITEEVRTRIAGAMGVWKRNAANTPIQGSSAEITKLAMVYIHRELLKRNLIDYIKIVNMIHDELLYEVKDDYIDIAKELVGRNMIKAGAGFLGVLKLKVSIDVGKYWIH